MRLTIVSEFCPYPAPIFENPEAETVHAGMDFDVYRLQPKKITQIHQSRCL
jgi:hypothetical protein